MPRKKLSPVAELYKAYRKLSIEERHAFEDELRIDAESSVGIGMQRLQDGLVDMIRVVEAGTKARFTHKGKKRSQTKHMESILAKGVDSPEAFQRQVNAAYPDKPITLATARNHVPRTKRTAK